MYVRYKKWKQIPNGSEVYTVRHNGVRYEFWKKEKGICNVKNVEALESLLANSGSFQVAYEKYGIAFDSRGNEVEKAKK